MNLVKMMLNKFEKRDLVIKLHSEGKTYREIATYAHISLRDIKPILDKYEKRLRLESKKENSSTNNNDKTESISTRAFKLFKENKQPDDVAIELDISAKLTEKYWSQYLALKKHE